MPNHLMRTLLHSITKGKKGILLAMRGAVLRESEKERYSLRSYRFFSLYEVDYQSLKNYPIIAFAYTFCKLLIANSKLYTF